MKYGKKGKNHVLNLEPLEEVHSEFEILLLLYQQIYVSQLTVLQTSPLPLFSCFPTVSLVLFPPEMTNHRMQSFFRHTVYCIL